MTPPRPIQNGIWRPWLWYGTDDFPRFSRRSRVSRVSRISWRPRIPLSLEISGAVGVFGAPGNGCFPSRATWECQAFDTVSRATWECHAFDTLSQTASRFMCGWEGKNGAALDEFDTAAAAAFARAARMRLRSVSKRPGDVACPP